MPSSLFSLTPTFTQGLLIGQISIFLLLALVLKYLFLETTPSLPRTPGLTPFQTQTHHNQPQSPPISLPLPLNPNEPVEWVNVILLHIARAYRRELSAGMDGPSGGESARRLLEGWVNKHRGTLLDEIHITSVNIGNDAPKLRSAQVLPPKAGSEDVRIECDVLYTDDVSASLSTSVLFHYPTPSFARLPVSLTLSLSTFSAKILVTPPAPSDPSPCLTVTLDPSFVLDITTQSLLGSRAKLSDVPKIHELIAQRIRSGIAERGTWKILLPGVRTKDVVDMLSKTQTQ
ncbi:ERMES complex subunit mmm1 [Tulasnella sp. JGI-2019a]|nr:ERMES complex subunit mmm1 [Tulasnella sp. JGI-2019a]KAG9028537.1 ERMES complex subunit mmm1 [Tulasnella sp. JGI-2019a]